jgi:pilus assembly protein Flp/PilA
MPSRAAFGKSGGAMQTTSMIRDQDGATMVEYGLLVALIAMVAFAAVQTLGLNLSTLFSTTASTV